MAELSVEKSEKKKPNNNINKTVDDTISELKCRIRYANGFRRGRHPRVGVLAAVRFE